MPTAIAKKAMRPGQLGMKRATAAAMSAQTAAAMNSCSVSFIAFLRAYAAKPRSSMDVNGRLYPFVQQRRHCAARKYTGVNRLHVYPQTQDTNARFWRKRPRTAPCRLYYSRAQFVIQLRHA